MSGTQGQSPLDVGTGRPAGLPGWAFMFGGEMWEPCAMLCLPDVTSIHALLPLLRY